MAGLKSKYRLYVRYVMFEVRSKLWCLSMPVGSGVGLFLLWTLHLGPAGAGDW